MKSKTPDVVTLSQAKEALLRSGYLLESRVANELRNRAYYVQENDIYADPETGKSREYDVLAIGAEQCATDEHDFIFPVFVFECVNNPQPIAFFCKELQAPFLHHQEVKLSGLPVKVFEDDTELRLSEFLEMENYHHYCNGIFATQFCSFKQKSQTHEWMAFHEDSHFNCIKALCDAVEYKLDEHFRSWRYGTAAGEHVNVQMYYPVLVIQGELMRADVTAHGVELTDAHHVQFRRTFLRDQREVTCQMDVITESFLKNFIDLCEREVKRTAELIQKNEKRILGAIEKIRQEAHGKSKNEFRAVMDMRN